MSKIMKFSLISGGIFLGSLILLLLLQPWAFVDNYELGYKFNKIDGTITVIEHPGYISRTPFLETVQTIDLRPRQVCINVGYSSGSDSPNRRVLNCKLVQFDPKGLALFLSWHGRDSYEGSTLDDLLKIYAYDGTGRNYPFLKVLRELKTDDSGLAEQMDQPTVVPMVGPTTGKPQ